MHTQPATPFGPVVPPGFEECTFPVVGSLAGTIADLKYIEHDDIPGHIADLQPVLLALSALVELAKAVDDNVILSGMRIGAQARAALLLAEGERMLSKPWRPGLRAVAA